MTAASFRSPHVLHPPGRLHGRDGGGGGAISFGTSEEENDIHGIEKALLSGRLSRSGRMTGTVDVRITGVAKAREQTLLAKDWRF